MLKDDSCGERANMQKVKEHLQFLPVEDSSFLFPCGKDQAMAGFGSCLQSDLRCALWLIGHQDKCGM